MLQSIFYIAAARMTILRCQCYHVTLRTSFTLLLGARRVINVAQSPYFISFVSSSFSLRCLCCSDIHLISVSVTRHTPFQPTPPRIPIPSFSAWCFLQGLSSNSFLKEALLDIPIFSSVVLITVLIKI